MGHTNQTANYNLPQFVGTDKPSWLGDINDAFAAIDTAIAAAASEASTADGKADALGTTVSGHTTQIGTLQNTVTTQGNTLNTVTSLIGNGTPTTTDQTIIGAINELHANQGDLSDLTTTDKSSLVAAINEAAQGGGGGGASVEVTADGIKNYKQLLEELYALVDYDSVTTNAKLTYDYHIMSIGIKSTTYGLNFSAVTSDGTKLYTDAAVVFTTSGLYSGENTTFTNMNSSIPTSGSKIKLYY